MSENEWNAALISELRRVSSATLLEDAGSLSRAGSDFGGVVQGDAMAVVVPRDPSQLEAVLRFANQRRLPLTVRAGGNSQSGQSVPQHGVSLDLSRLDRVLSLDVEGATVECEPAARWRDVVARTAEAGFLPRVMPLNLDLTVGGTLAAGGMGATSHRYGALVSHVKAASGVTGDGQSMNCSSSDNVEFFDALLGGVGRCGVITQASVLLRKIQPCVTTFFFCYDDIDAWLHDQQASAPHCDYLEAFCAGSVMGLRRRGPGRVPFARWSYGMQVSIEHAEGEEPNRDHVQSRCPGGTLLHVEQDDTVSFASRYDSRFAFMRRVGAWQLSHPWVEMTIPLDSAGEALPKVLDAVPLFLGDGHRVNLLAAAPKPRFFMVPEGPLALSFAILPAGVAPALHGDALKALAAIHDMLVSVGGKRYLSGWLGMMDEAGWRRHYAGEYDAWLLAKRRFDPNGVLCSALFPG